MAKDLLSPSTDALARTSHPQPQPVLSGSDSDAEGGKPSFSYDLDIFNQCKHYLETKNQYGLSLIARQKGVPPFLRFKVWPILLKYHPYVLSPFIQPTTDTSSSSNPLDDGLAASSASSPAALEEELAHKIRRDLRKYVTRLLFQNSIRLELSATEEHMFDVMEKAVLRFSTKWIQVIKYHPSLTWFALNLAEWFPPVPNTSWVLAGRDVVTSKNLLAVDMFHDYSNYIDNIAGLKEYLHTAIGAAPEKSMRFHDVYERLVLVLMHSPEEKTSRLASGLAEPSLLLLQPPPPPPPQLLHVMSEVRLSLLLLLALPPNEESAHPARASRSGSDLPSCFEQACQSASSPSSASSSSSPDSSSPPESLQFSRKAKKSLLPINGGTIEERVSFFIYCLRKVLPELSDYFHEEQILNKFGAHDDEWVIWWLNYCGAKVWSKFDRGRIWDMLLGWRLKTPKRNTQYYVDKLDLTLDDSDFIGKMGPDVFWSLSNLDYGMPPASGSGLAPPLKDLSQLPDSFSRRADDFEPRRNSFKELVHELNSSERSLLQETTLPDALKDVAASPLSCSSSVSSARSSLLLFSVSDSNEDLRPKITHIPFSKLDDHVQLIFIALAFLKSKQNLLMELDQHEIRQYLLRLPLRAYLFGKKRKSLQESKSGEPEQLGLRISRSSSRCSSTSLRSRNSLTAPSLGSNAVIISNDSDKTHKIDFIDNIIEEAGDLWRKWLWLEMVEDAE